MLCYSGKKVGRVQMMQTFVKAMGSWISFSVSATNFLGVREGENLEISAVTHQREHYGLVESGCRRAV